ncbi:uncharacterized protein METZ01_LOCUS62980, partial [marine metagenome]
RRVVQEKRREVRAAGDELTARGVQGMVAKLKI